MTDEFAPKGEVKIFPADYALKRKIGNVNLDQILTPKIVEAAQEVIVNSSGQLLDEVFSETKMLDLAGRALKAAPDKWQKIIPEIIPLAFAIKTKAGLGGYGLASTIAKSLQVFCEQLEGGNLSAKNVDIIIWHIESIKRLLALKVAGTGGQTGEDILAEMEKIKQQ